MPKNKFRFIMTPNAEQHEAVKAYAEKKGLRIVEAYQELTAHGLKSHELAGKEPPAMVMHIDPEVGKNMTRTTGQVQKVYSPGDCKPIASDPELIEQLRNAVKPVLPMNPDKAFRASSGLPVGPVPRKGFMPKKGQK